MAMSMSKISDCEVTDCSYNQDKKCHTMAITVGDSKCALCDTYVQAKMKGGEQSTIGGVGACKADSCKYNKDLECNAGMIHVGFHQNHAECTTYSPS